MVQIRKQIQAATTAAVSWSIFEGDSFDVRRVMLNFATAPTTGSVTVTVDSAEGSAYDTLLKTIPVTGKTSLVIEGITGLADGDKIVIAFANTESISVVGYAAVEPTSGNSASCPTIARVLLDGLIVSEAYDAGNDALQVVEQVPEPIQYLNYSVSTGAVPAATPYTLLIDGNGYKNGIHIQVEKKAGAGTFAATYDTSIEGYAAGDDWLDSYTNGFDLVAGADLTVDHIVKTKVGYHPAGVLLTITCAGADDNEFDIHVKEL